MLRVRISSFVLAVYWIAIFTATHFPRTPSIQGQPVHFDKIAHFAAFLGLAAIMAWAWHGRQSTRWSSLVAIWTIAATYGIADELTQLLCHNRNADIYDWLADLAGALTGLAIYVVCRHYKPGQHTTAPSAGFAHGKELAR